MGRDPSHRAPNTPSTAAAATALAAAGRALACPQASEYPAASAASVAAMLRR